MTAKMLWRVLSSGETLKAKDESRRWTLKFSIVVEIKPSHNGDSFTCQTYFDIPQSRDHFADNKPINNNAFNETFTFPKLRVYCKYWVHFWFELSHIVSPLGRRSSGFMASLYVCCPPLALRCHKLVKIYFLYLALFALEFDKLIFKYPAYVHLGPENVNFIFSYSIQTKLFCSFYSNFT